MKKIAALFLLIGLNVFGQSIQKKDGSTVDISGGQIHVEAGNKRLAYFVKASKKAQYVKFKDLDQATWGDFKFKTFEVGGKRNGYYIIAQNAGKTLVSNKRIRVKSRGGFESTYTHYEVAVLEGQKTLETLSFTDENSDKKAAERSKVIPMIKAHFADCAKLMEKATAFESPSSDTKNSTILVFLNEPTWIECQ